MAQHHQDHWKWTLGALAAVGASMYLYRRQQWRAEHSFRNQVVLITGGSRGLGLELARLWVAEGAKVAICARNYQELERALAELKNSSHDVIAIECDVTQSDQVEALVEKVVVRWGKIDVLVNNAGMIQAGPLNCVTIQDFERALATHFWAPLHTIRACLPYMVGTRWGRIVNIASFGGEVSVPHLLPYSASKFALVGLSDGLASELRQQGIRVTTVCPGLMRTGSPRNAEFKGDHRAEYAWFSTSAALPVFSIQSRRAARAIFEACRHGKRFLRVGMPAKIAAPVRAVAPNFVGQLLGLVAGLLSTAAKADPTSHKGYQSFSEWSPSALTQLNEAAAERNNEMFDGTVRWDGKRVPEV